MQDQSQTDLNYRHADAATDMALDWLMRLREDHNPLIWAEFRRWHDANPENARVFATVAATWHSPALLSALTRSNGLSDGLVRPTRARGKMLAAAAVVVVALGLWQAPHLRLWWQADHMTDPGMSARVELPDGTAVVLNTATAIATDFTNGRRSVRLLEGEAFFDVAHDRARPFIVSTDRGDVRVTGTAFSVRIGSESDEVLLRNGNVEVRSGATTVRLSPGEGAVLDGTEARSEGSRNVDRALAWLGGRIEIVDQPLSQALGDVARYAADSVVILPSAEKALAVSGSFRTADPQAALAALAAAGGLSLRHIPGGVIILY